jgi:hypothetical protein
MCLPAVGIRLKDVEPAHIVDAHADVHEIIDPVAVMRLED